jgi:hypothetical protein
MPLSVEIIVLRRRPKGRPAHTHVFELEIDSSARMFRLNYNRKGESL